MVKLKRSMSLVLNHTDNENGSYSSRNSTEKSTMKVITADIYRLDTKNSGMLLLYIIVQNSIILVTKVSIFIYFTKCLPQNMRFSHKIAKFATN